LQIFSLIKETFRLCISSKSREFMKSRDRRETCWRTHGNEATLKHQQCGETCDKVAQGDLVTYLPSLHFVPGVFARIFYDCCVHCQYWKFIVYVTCTIDF